MATCNQDYNVIESDEMIKILEGNKGFDKPIEWVDYAIRHNFKRVDASKIDRCPDCKSTTSKKIGQYIYYSNLAFLLECGDCGLIYSDLVLGKETSGLHFESAYKDHDYFVKQRRPIYNQIATMLLDILPFKGKIIDIGGAQGHLSLAIKELRTDIDATVCDVSRAACDYARNNFGIETICGTLTELKIGKENVYDVVLLIDTLYYEQNIKDAWDMIPELTSKGIVMRIPNKLWLIRLMAFIKKIKGILRKGFLEDSVPAFNPEHLYIFSIAYIKHKLHEAEFNEVKVIPARGLATGTGFIERLIYTISMMIYVLTFKKIIISPSVIVLAIKED